EREERGGLLSRWRRGRSEPIQSGGCDPAVFAEQISEYLREAAAERAALVESERDARHPIVTAAAVVETAPIAESDPVAAFEPEPELEPFVEPVTEPIVA